MANENRDITTARHCAAERVTVRSMRCSGVSVSAEAMVGGVALVWLRLLKTLLTLQLQAGDCVKMS